MHISFILRYIQTSFIHNIPCQAEIRTRACLTASQRTTIWTTLHPNLGHTASPLSEPRYTLAEPRCTLTKPCCIIDVETKSGKNCGSVLYTGDPYEIFLAQRYSQLGATHNPLPPPQLQIVSNHWHPVYSQTHTCHGNNTLLYFLNTETTNWVLEAALWRILP